MSQTVKRPIQRYVKVSQGDLSDCWFDAYGWIACYFAQLEGLSYALIDSLAPQADRARLKTLAFAKRTDRAKSLVCRYLRARGEVRLAAEWAQLLDEACDSARMRNDILHNPLTISLALGDPLDDEDIGILLTRKPGHPVVKLGAVQEFAQTMLELNLRVQDLLSRSGLPPT